MKKIVIKKLLLLIFLSILISVWSIEVNAAQINLPSDLIQNIDSRFAGIYINYGDGYANKEEYDLAESFYRQAITLEPDNLKAKYRLGLILELQKDFEGAEKVYREVIKTDDKEMQAYYSLGLVLDQLDKSLEGIKQLEKALEFEPDNAFINYDIGVVYAKLRDFPKSKYFSLKAAELKPDFSEALNNLCYAQANIGEYEEAIKNCEKSLEIKPDSAATIDSLGFAYYGMGDIDTAIEKYLEALKNDNTIGEIYFHLGESYDKQKKDAYALVAYKKYLELEKEPYNLTEVTDRIKELEKIVSKDDYAKAELDIKVKLKPSINLNSTSNLEDFLKPSNVKIMDPDEMQDSPDDEDIEIEEIEEPETEE